MGKLGLPLFEVGIYDPVTLPSGHALNAVLVGDDFTKWEDWNFIEGNYETMNNVPGGEGTNLPLNCEQVSIGYYYMTINDHGQKLLNGVLVLEFKLVDGIPHITYNVNYV